MLIATATVVHSC